MRPRTFAAFADLVPQAPDPLLSLIAAFALDPRPGKIDLGVGVYRTAAGHTPVFRAVKAAEDILLEQQTTKSYLGPEGDLGFLERIEPIVFGRGAAASDLLAVQTPGGTGALRLAAELLAAGRPGTRVHLGAPSWPIHGQILRKAGLEVLQFAHFDSARQTLSFEAMHEHLSQAGPGETVLLHGCCHNPSGANPDLSQWRALAQLIAERGLVPLIDLAYQGLGAGLEEDAAGLRLVMEASDHALVAYSLDKNFGLYRERVGALFVRARGQADAVRSNLLQLARCAWSMPPDHGAATARVILEDPHLTVLWREELEVMRLRLARMRADLVHAVPSLAGLAAHHGMFALLPLSPIQVDRLRRDHGVYMAGSGRINLAGLNPDNLPTFAQALNACLQEEPA